MAVHRPLAAVVLAAGEGTRMRSTTPKVLHPLAGRPMLAHLVDTLVSLPIERVVVVVGHRADEVTASLSAAIRTPKPVDFVDRKSTRLNSSHRT